MPTPKRNHPESDLQKAVFKWFTIQHKKYCYVWLDKKGKPHRGSLLVKNSNESRNGEMRRFIDYSEGLNAGLYDMSLKVAKKGFHGLEIELKIGRNKLSDAQLAYKAMVEMQGYKCVECWTLESVIKEVTEYLED